MRILKNAFYGLCMGLLIVLFHQYVWSVIRPFFIEDRIDPEYKIFLLVVLILIGIVVAIVGMLYERREILELVNGGRKKRAIQIGFLVALILIGSLAFSIALEF